MVSRMSQETIMLNDLLKQAKLTNELLARIAGALERQAPVGAQQR
jgi:hypothetical protein